MTIHRFDGMALLLWNAIQGAKDKGMHELDMGRSDCDNAGLHSSTGIGLSKNMVAPFIGFPECFGVCYPATFRYV